jgi:hypothetical protein
MKKFLSLIALLLMKGIVLSQFGVSAGPSVLKGFNYPGVYAGFGLGVEVPTNSYNSIFVRLTHYAGRKDNYGQFYFPAKDFNTIPNSVLVDVDYTHNYTVIEGGKRVYFGDGYDSGLGFYGGSTLSGVFNTIKVKTGTFDETKYEYPNIDLFNEPKGSVFSVAFGLSGGVKNTFYFGTLYADIAANINILGGVTSNNTAGITKQYSSIFFVLSFGYRKDIF